MTASCVPGGFGHRLWFGFALPLLVTRLFAGRVRVMGAERVPLQGPVLFVGRHRAGLMDGWLYAHALPRPTVFVIAARLRRTWLLRPLVAGISVMRRKDGGAGRGGANHAALLACQGELAAGRTVFIFPEGTSTLGQDLLPLEPGAAKLALLVPGTAVVPLAIHYADPVSVGTDVEIAFGKPIYLTPNATTEQAQAQLGAAIQSIVPAASPRHRPGVAISALADTPVRWIAGLAGRVLADDDTAVLTWATMIGLPMQMLWSGGLLVVSIMAGWPGLGVAYVTMLALRLLRPTERRRA